MKERIKADIALQTAETVSGILRKEGYKAEICGSLRRGRPEVGDIDIVTNAELGGLFFLLSARMMNVKYFGGGSKKVQLEINRIQVDFYSSDERSWGAMILFLTGSAQFNIMMRGVAKKKGYLLSQYGVFKGSELIASRTEKEIFNVLGMIYKEPSERNL